MLIYAKFIVGEINTSCRSDEIDTDRNSAFSRMLSFITVKYMQLAVSLSADAPYENTISAATSGM